MSKNWQDTFENLSEVHRSHTCHTPNENASTGLKEDENLSYNIFGDSYDL